MVYIAELVLLDTYPGVASDLDINSFTTKDLKDISKAGIGTAGREGVAWLELIITIVIVVAVLGLIAVGIAKAKGLTRV